jgi:hypothetical protein
MFFMLMFPLLTDIGGTMCDIYILGTHCWCWHFILFRCVMEYLRRCVWDLLRLCMNCCFLCKIQKQVHGINQVVNNNNKFIRLKLAKCTSASCMPDLGHNTNECLASPRVNISPPAIGIGSGKSKNCQTQNQSALLCGHLAAQSHGQLQHPLEGKPAL